MRVTGGYWAVLDVRPGKRIRANALVTVFRLHIWVEFTSVTNPKLFRKFSHPPHEPPESYRPLSPKYESYLIVSPDQPGGTDG